MHPIRAGTAGQSLALGGLGRLVVTLMGVYRATAPRAQGPGEGHHARGSLSSLTSHSMPESSHRGQMTEIKTESVA